MGRVPEPPRKPKTLPPRLPLGPWAEADSPAPCLTLDGEGPPPLAPPWPRQEGNWLVLYARPSPEHFTGTMSTLTEEETGAEPGYKPQSDSTA